MLGRKRTIIVGSSIMVVGAAIQCSSFSLGQLIAARLITGFGNGMNTSTVPTWQAETSKSHRRGQMVMIEGSLIVFGVMISYWIDLGCSFIPNSAAWRFPIAFQIVLALIILLIIPRLPESPRWWETPDVWFVMLTATQAGAERPTPRCVECPLRSVRLT